MKKVLSKRNLWRIAIYPLMYLAGGLFLFVFQRDFIYFPVEPVKNDFLTQVIKHDEIDLIVQVLNPGKKRAVLYFGGNAENVVLNGEAFQNKFIDTTFYLVNYRAYGGSDGRPTEKGILSDALYLYDNLLSGHELKVVMGRSLGSGVAVYLAKERDFDKLVLITPYDSIARLAQNKIKIYPIKYILIDTFDSYSRASHVDEETLVLVAENDKVIPRENSANLASQFSNARLSEAVIPGRGHNDIHNSNEFYTQIQRFLFQQ